MALDFIGTAYEPQDKIAATTPKIASASMLTGVDNDPMEGQTSISSSDEMHDLTLSVLAPAERTFCMFPVLFLFIFVVLLLLLFPHG